jgi:carbonic anhydrase
MSQDPYDYMLASNEAWAAFKTHQNPNFFLRQADVEAPRILWLGCSDSSMPETTILGLQAGDVMSHRNAGNIIIPTDLNTSAAVEYAIHVLDVQRIVLCGHSTCDSMRIALSNNKAGGVLDRWLAPLKILIRSNKTALENVNESWEVHGSQDARVTRLAELNVQMGILALFRNAGVEKAIRDKGLRIHGVIYDNQSGKIRDLGFGNSKFSLKNTRTRDTGLGSPQSSLEIIRMVPADPMLERLWQ